MRTSYEDFINSYAAEVTSAVVTFDKLDTEAIIENGEDLQKACEKIDSIYDTGVSLFFERAIYGSRDLNLTTLADLALQNMGRYGTEMKQILNALEDFTHYLRKYLPEEDDE